MPGNHRKSKRKATASTSVVHVRMDANLKAQATETLASMGMTVSAAIRVFLARVVTGKECVFAANAPNAASRAAIAEANEIVGRRRARLSNKQQR